ncbi:MAG: peptide chain release factor 2 [Lachnospiraceae bacterium]|nr:peptide chain release factor 2 [Lachnospiraceae bacterium]
MVEYDQFKYTLSQYETPLQELRSALALDQKKEQISELSMYMEDPNFWNDAEKSAEITKKLKNLQDTVKEFDEIEKLYDDMNSIIEIAEEMEDGSLVDDVQADMDSFKEKFEELRVTTLLSDEFDHNDAILRLNAGAGGTEACDWAGMLYRMYTRWAEKKGYSIEVLDYLDGDEAGIKSVTIQITGENAYGYLRSEHGIHRLVRISPFNAVGKRMTSFVSCDIMPVIEQSLDVDIKDDDLKIDVYRSSGAGGQHINKTSSAVRITHIPTGIVVACQNERSHFQNLDKAMEMLRAKLYLLKKQENENQLSDIRGEVKDNGWGSQIRSYVFQPYTMVKDLRTQAETGNVQAVMDGGLDLFMNAYLKWIHTDRKANE